MLIADSQVHLWGANTPARPWPPGRDHEAQKPYPVTKDMLLFEMELAKVNRIVIVPPSWEGDRNDLALEAARLHPDKFAVMGRLNLTDPASKALVPDWKKQPGMLGIAGNHPGLKLVIDHVGLNIRQKAPKVFEDLPAVCALAKHPNIAVKASGMPSLSTQEYPFRDLHDAIRRLVDAYGPRRTFWGTDLTRMPCTYRECIDLFTKEQPWLKGQDLEWVMGRGVCEGLGWRM
jgi:L-fuconolactonase